MKHRQTKLDEFIRTVIKGPVTFSPNIGEGTLVSIISIKDLKSGIIILDPEQKRILKTSESLEKYRIKEKDVLVAIRGDFRAAIVHLQATDYVINQNLVCIRLNDKLLPEVLVVFLNSKKGQQQLIAKSRGTTIPSISIKDLLDIQVPILPMEIQKVITKCFASFQEFVTLAQEEKELVNKMMDSIVMNYLE